MADILSQEEIDALLSATDGDDGGGKISIAIFMCKMISKIKLYIYCKNI